MDKVKTTLGNLISFYRHKKKLNQEQLADKLSTVQSKISDWENDKISPTVNEILTISHVLKVNPIQLIQNENRVDEFKANSLNQEQNVNYCHINSTDEERNAYKEALRTKDEMLKLKDEIIESLRMKINSK